MNVVDTNNYWRFYFANTNTVASLHTCLRLASNKRKNVSPEGVCYVVPGDIRMFWLCICIIYGHLEI